MNAFFICSTECAETKQNNCNTQIIHWADARQKPWLDTSCSALPHLAGGERHLPQR